MLIVDVRLESTPTLALNTALTAQLAMLPALPRLQWDLTLRVVPRPTHDAAPVVTADAWYDLVWSIPALCTHDPQPTLPNCHEMYWDPDSDGEHYVHEGWFDVERAGVFPAPPEIPFDARLAAAPEITDADVDAWETRQPGATRLLGGRDKARKVLESNRVHSVQHDRTAGRYDWDAHATALLERYRSLTPPKVTTAQRLRFVGVRLLRARQEEAGARQSAAALLRNAEQANREAPGDSRPAGRKSDWTQWVGVSRPTIDAWLTAPTGHEPPA